MAMMSCRRFAQTKTRIKTMTNLDRIKNMTLDEMAELLDTKACKCCAYYSTPPCGFKDCRDGIKKWLEQEAAE